MQVAQVENVIMAAVGGIPATEVVDGRERYPVTVRLAREFRDDPTALERIMVPVSTNAMGRMGSRQIPITQVADIHFRTGPPMLRNEDGQLAGFVLVDVGDSIGIADYVDLARGVVDERVSVPSGFRIAWAGQFRQFERAKSRLQMLVPLTLLIVFLMLYVHRKSLADALLVMAMVPFALIGSVCLIALLDFKLSVAVWVGMIAMAGLAAEMGLLMLFYLDQALRQAPESGQLHDSRDLIRALAEGAGQRVRPILMTVLTLVASLLPVMSSDGTGADVMKRIAAPMAGGIVTALLAVLLLLPAVFALWKAYAIAEDHGKTPETVTEMN